MELERANMKKILFSILCLLLSVQLAFGAAIEIFSPNAGNKPVQGDVDGTLFNTERFPRESKYTLFNLANGATLATGATGETGNTTTAFPVSSLLAMKMIRIQCTGQSGSGTVNFILQGSYDGITFAPVYQQKIGTSVVDTVQFVMTAAQSIASPGAWIRFEALDNGIPITLPYYRFLVKNRSFSAGGTITYTIDGYGRQF